MSPYAALWCKSNFSFLEGASHPQELVEQAHALGLTALALTDRNGVPGIVRGHVRAKELGLHLIVGSQLTLTSGGTLTLLATDRGGYANLCRLVTAGRRRSPKGECTVRWAEACEHAAGLIALWGGRESRIAEEPDDARIDPLARDLRDAFGDRAYALVARHRHATDLPLEQRTRERAARHGLPVVAAAEVLYHELERRALQDVLTCIRHKTTIRAAGNHTHPNAEHALRPPDRMAALFADDPDALARTNEIAARCTFDLAQIRYRYPAERLPDGKDSNAWLRELTFAGAHQRYGGPAPTDVRAQLNKELDLIERLDYGGYFLTMYEIVRFCNAEGILCQGRGSAANSAVCFCLGITAVDPVRMGLLFERFLSQERAEPPDIDLDIEHDRREEVIQHVYAKYGRTHAAMVANVISYRSRSAIRDVGKALGFPLTTVDRIAKLTGHWGSLNEETLREAGCDPNGRTERMLATLHNQILGFPRHLSIHPGGFLLGHEPVHDLVPIENGSMPDRTVIQWDKDDIEALGLFKVDLLGLGALNQLHRAFDLLAHHRGEQWSMATIPANDPPTYAMICRADTLGTFQIESRAQMSMLPRLQPRYFYDLVIEVSIVRPGPISGGMVHPYLRRRRGEEPVTYPHPALEPVLSKTLGIPLFQEQVMKLAMVAADYTPGEADQLRRDMAAWKKHGNLDRHRDKLIPRMLAKGIKEEFAERVFEQIKGFGDYGFPEAHAASFALIAYATAWLRCHYPAEFLCSLLNAQPMGFYSAATLVHDGRRRGVEVRPVDIAVSDWDCTLEPLGASPLDGFAVRIGLRYVKTLRKDEGERILEVRNRRPFTSVEDFADRTHLAQDSCQVLAEAGAFDPIDGTPGGPSRRKSLWAARGVARTEKPDLELQDVEQPPEFAELGEHGELAWDFNTQRLSIRGHQLTPLRESLTALGLPVAHDVEQLKDGARVRYAGMVLNRQRPHTASGVTFITLEDETGWVNLVVWPKVYEAHALIARAAKLMGVTGRMQVKDGTHHLIVESIWEPEEVAAKLPKSSKSRDFR